MSTQSENAIILVGHGAPASVSAIPAFLTQIRRGRPASLELANEIVRRYSLIGGASPYILTVHRLASKLKQHTGKTVLVGMKHGTPSLEDALSAFECRFDSGVAICLAPHFSNASVGSYFKAFEGKAGIRTVRSWHLHPSYIRALILALRELNPNDGNTQLIFTAHSLPLQFLTPDDPYAQQVRETAAAVALGLELGDDQWQVAYQSDNNELGAWLGPRAIDVVDSIAAKKERKRIIVAPIGFTIDNVEILYDLDIELKARIESYGMRYDRMAMLNASQSMLEILAAQ